MQWSDIPFRPTTRILRQFAGLCVLFLVGMAAWRYLRFDEPTAAAILLGFAVAAGGVGLLRPHALRPLFVGWMIVAFPIGWMVSRVLLGIVYYGLFTPLGLLFRLAGRDPLALSRASRDSYWEAKPAPVDVRRYFHQF